MAIIDLQPKQGNVDIVAEIVSKDEPRTFEKFGKQGKVCNAKIKDESGEMTLSLWNEQVDEVKVGDKVHITNGWVSEWQGEKQLSTGKFGKLEVLEGKEKDATADEETESKLLEGVKSDQGEKVLSEDEKKETEINVDEEEVM